MSYPQTVPRVTHTTPRHLPDIFQTHYRHYKILQILTNPRQLGQKEAAIINGCLSIACISHPSRQYPEPFRQPQTPSRHLPDTLQTPYRHPKMKMFTHQRQQGEKEPANKNESIGFLSIASTPPTPDSIQSHSDNPQTPPRHLPDTSQTPYRHMKRN